MDTKLEASFNLIVDTITGADGGVSFVMFNSFIKEMDRRALAGDKDATKVLEVVHQFARLIQVSQ